MKIVKKTLKTSELGTDYKNEIIHIKGKEKYKNREGRESSFVKTLKNKWK